MILDVIKNYNGDAIIDGSGVFSFQDLVKQVAIYQALLEDEIRNNDRVLIHADYNFHSIAMLICLSSFNINIIPVVKTTEAEFKEKVDSVNPHWILSFKEVHEIEVNKIERTESEDLRFSQVTSNGDTGIVLFSSGTTGKPKVMIQNLNNLISSIDVPRKQKTLRFIILLMFDHIGGLNTLLNGLISGTPLIIPSDKNPSTIISLIQEHQVNILPTTPTFLNLMLMDESFSPEKFESIKLITYGTERMSDILLEKLNKQLPKIKLLQTFGTSETGILKTQSKSSSSLFFKIVDDQKEFKILDGELYLRSKTQVMGYLNHINDNFKDDGWYATGDLVETDGDGYIKIIGRKNKIINVGGLKVLPKEIEDIINSVEGVDDSLVFGEENNLVGNIVCAKVYTSRNDTKELKSRIKSVCRGSLDKYKMPVKIYFEKLRITQRGKKWQN